MKVFKEAIGNVERTAQNAESHFDPDKLIKPSEVKSENASPSSKFDPDRFIDLEALLKEKLGGDSLERGDAPSSNESKLELYSTSEARKKFAESSDGTWSGEPGDSALTPNDVNVRKTMEKFGETCIRYKDGVVDFTPFSKETVSINITPDIVANRTAAYEAVEEKWNAEMKDGRSDWRMRDVDNWKKENNLAFHECSDMRTVQFVPKDIHRAALHFGGRYEARCKEMLTNGGGFDD